MKKTICISTILLILGGVLAGCPSSAPLIIAFAINSGATSTSNSTVTLDNECTEVPTHYMASESPSFAGASWQTYDSAPLFTLSAGTGTKTVYFKVVNEVGESEVVSDTITLSDNNTTDETILLPGGVPLEMVWCPPGTFLMGRSTGELESHSEEAPQHQVTLQGFWMSTYEVTKAQWTALMGTSPWAGQSYVLNDPDSPAVYISWNDVQSFITALNTHTSQSFHLPYEAQWEYACRAGTTTRFYWGDDLNYTLANNYAWYWENSSNGQYAHIGGQKLPNAWGLFDMSGNVWEWCQDWYGDYPSGEVTDPTGPTGPTDYGSYRVVRGGSWINANYDARSARRLSTAPDSAYYYLGFRVVRTP